MKYITKTYTDTDKDNQLTQSLCWIFNIRSYQCSRGLINPIKNNNSTTYTAKYLIIVNDKIPIGLLTKNIELLSKIINQVNPYKSDYYRKMEKLIKDYN